MRKLIVCLVLVGCGQVDKKEEKAEATSEKLGTVDNDVEWSGYVQKAFTIKVNNKEFADSEDFYTRFIEELVKPQYPDLSDKEVTVEGKYGLSEFGAGSSVFMSSQAADGHLYEGRTNAQSKFTLKVAQKATDETFKARIIVRIGLEVRKGDNTTRHCYILHGNKTDIAVSESSKPIIFDDFSTQLTTYKCEDVNDTLVIPSAEDKDHTDTLPKGTTVEKTVVVDTTTDEAAVDNGETELTGQLMTDGHVSYLVSMQRGRILLKKLRSDETRD